jgi:hypothetical protein
MKQLLIMLIFALGMGFAFAQGVTVSTPAGDFSIMLTGVDPNGETTSGYVVDEISTRVEKLRLNYISKLKKSDAKKANELIEEIYYLLGLLPEDTGVYISDVIEEEEVDVSENTNVNTNNNSININIINSQAQQTVTPPPPADNPPQQSGRLIIQERDFSDLVSAIGREGFSDDKLGVLRTAAKSYRFNCDQIGRLIGCFSYSDDKLDALRISWTEVVDPQNSFRVLDKFNTFDKDEARQIMN